MPAEKEKLGILAGGGALPYKLLSSCKAQGIEVFVVAFKGQTDEALVQGVEHVWTSLGKVGKIISTLQAHDVRDLVLIGSIRRPSFSELKPDLRGAKLLSSVVMKSLGDDDLLGIVRKELEHEGFNLYGVQRYVGDLLMPSGALGKVKPSKHDQVQIVRGIEVSQTIGAMDIGQSIVVQEGIVLAVEAVEGTDALIKRCKHLVRKGHGPVLVKTCKPQQDRDLDLPTIGPDTVRAAHESGFAGLAVHAGHALVLDQDEVAALADQYKMFVVGVDL